MSVVNLADTRRKPNMDLVRVLEKLLVQANSGEITSAAIAVTNFDETTSSHITSTPNQIVRLAAVSRLLHKLQLSMDDSV